MSSPQTTASDLAAVAEAIREHDRFVLTTHENPDGDALGSLLAANLALEQLGKDTIMVLHGDAPLPVEYGFMPLGDLQRRWPDDVAERVPERHEPILDRRGAARSFPRARRRTDAGHRRGSLYRPR